MHLTCNSPHNSYTVRCDTHKIKGPAVILPARPHPIETFSRARLVMQQKSLLLFAKPKVKVIIFCCECRDHIVALTLSVTLDTIYTVRT